MPEYLAPGVFVEEVPAGVHPIPGVSTSIAAFIGRAVQGPVNDPIAVHSWGEFETAFGGIWQESELGYVVHHFFLNGGEHALIVRLSPSPTPPSEEDLIGSLGSHTGLHALEKTDLFNLLCFPPLTSRKDLPLTVIKAAMAYCLRRRAMSIVDPPSAWGSDPAQLVGETLAGLKQWKLSSEEAAKNAALYLPRVVEVDPLKENTTRTTVPCGVVAGIMARTDTQRGVWKAPAGTEAPANGIHCLQAALTQADTERLNRRAVNCLRRVPGTGLVVWGASTLAGTDGTKSDFKYVPVRRLALYLEESLYRGLQWAVFEPNTKELWDQIRRSVEVFLFAHYIRGAFQGKTAEEAYFVRCDEKTMTKSDLRQRCLVVELGFAPVRPAEFVVLRIHLLMNRS
jgi:phage tail sheath protein FI